MAAVSRPVTREGRTCFARVDTTCAGACGDMRLGTTGPHPGKEREGGDTAQTPLLICSTIHSVPRRGGGHQWETFGQVWTQLFLGGDRWEGTSVSLGTDD